MTIKEKLAAKTAELEGLKAAIEENDAAAIEQGEKLAAEIDGLKADAEKAEKAASLLKRMGNKPVKATSRKPALPASAKRPPRSTAASRAGRSTAPSARKPITTP